MGVGADDRWRCAIVELLVCTVDGDRRRRGRGLSVVGASDEGALHRPQARLGAHHAVVRPLTFNFFLFRIMPGDPAGLLARSQRLTATEVAEQRASCSGSTSRCCHQYWKYLQGNAHWTSRHVVPDRATGGRDDRRRVWPTVLLVGVGTTVAIVARPHDGDQGWLAPWVAFDRSSIYGSLTLYSTPEGWLGMMLLIIFAGSLGWFPVGGYDSGGDLTGLAHVIDVAKHLVPAGCDLGAWLRRLVHDRDALFVDRGQGRGLRRRPRGPRDSPRRWFDVVTRSPTRFCPRSR